MDWKSSKISTNGAVFEAGNAIQDFLEKEKGIKLPDYSADHGKLEYVLVGRFDPERWVIIPKEELLTSEEGDAGLIGEYFSGRDLKSTAGKRADAEINFEWSGKEPFSSVGRHNFSVR